MPHARWSASAAWGPRLDPPSPRSRRIRPAVPPVQGGAAVGARAVPREERVRPARAACRGGAADDAGRVRHHARVGADRDDRRRDEGLLHPPAVGREGVSRDRAHGRRGARAYGRVCGWTLARAHARSGDRIAIAAYLGSGDAFDRAMASFAEAYADQNERDYRALRGRGRRPAVSRPSSSLDRHPSRARAGQTRRALPCSSHGGRELLVRSPQPPGRGCGLRAPSRPAGGRRRRRGTDCRGTTAAAASTRSRPPRRPSSSPARRRARRCRRRTA